MKVTVDKSSDIPLYLQIVQAVKERISAGILRSGDRLPTVQEMASSIGVTAATIRRAMQELTAEGLVDSHVGRGTFITDSSQQSVSAAGFPRAVHAESAGTFINTNSDDTAAKSRRDTQRNSFAAAKQIRQNINRSITDMLEAAAENPDTINFTRSAADPALFGTHILTSLTAEALAHGETIYHDYGDSSGLYELREAVARLYSSAHPFICAENVLITNGSQQAVALTAQNAAEENAQIICETPCYPGVTNILSAYSLYIETIQRSAYDLNFSAVTKTADTTYLYISPVVQNPLGTNLSKACCSKTAQWAADNNAVIISDEVFSCLDSDGRSPSYFLTNPGLERTIVLGSLSKSFMPGLRVGWMISSRERIASFARLKSMTDLGCPPLMQGIALAFLTNNERYNAHMHKIRQHNASLVTSAINALKTYMPDGVTWTEPDGGFQLWVTLPSGFSSVSLLMRSAEKGSVFLPGPLHDIHSRFTSNFRLCLGGLTPEEITEGIKRTAQAVKELMSTPRRETAGGVIGNI